MGPTASTSPRERGRHPCWRQSGNGLMVGIFSLSDRGAEAPAVLPGGEPFAQPGSRILSQLESDDSFREAWPAP